jgi:hypothetical protein
MNILELLKRAHDLERKALAKLGTVLPPAHRREIESDLATLRAEIKKLMGSTPAMSSDLIAKAGLGTATKIEIAGTPTHGELHDPREMAKRGKAEDDAVAMIRAALHRPPQRGGARPVGDRGFVDWFVARAGR